MSDDDSFSLGLDAPPQPVKPEAYRVLARKYRPQTFADLIGQDAMVQTLGNAIRRGRLAHAFLLTGVRGVGKTSTARLIAKALNCIGPDGQGGPTIDPCGVCDPCRAITEGRFIDVIEIDAASHNGVDDIREISEAVRYAAVSARYKIYIIDEVHMLSKPAFNAVLKTLEEPPPHVKFLLATTEVQKVPVTVLSRCQRFDLRRIPSDLLADHFTRVVAAEGVAVEPEALAMIARAADGSARDGLSILDQAISHAGFDGDIVRADAVRDMLGLSDRGAIRALLGLLLGGDAPGTLAGLRNQHDLGVDPLIVLRSLLETVHGITLAKVGARADLGHSIDERAALTEWAGKLSFPALHRLWQLLLKGHQEVAAAAMPVETAEMALLRVIHAASLPDPGDLARQIAEGGGASAPRAAPPASAPVAETGALPADLPALADLLATRGRNALEAQVRNLVRPIRYEPPLLEISGQGPLPADFARELAGELKELTGRVWRISISDVPGAPTLREIEAGRAQAERDAVLASPVVAAAMEAFPEAELIGWTRIRSETA